MKEIMQKDEVTPLEVKEVLIDCFCHAHGDPVIALHILKKQARDAGIDWDHPDKKAFEILIPRLAIVASSFRSPEIISENKQKFNYLLNKCKCD